MITWGTYFSLVPVLSALMQVKMPHKDAILVADYVDKFDAVRLPLVEWQKEVLLNAPEGEREFLWTEKMGEEVEIPLFSFGGIRTDFSPAEVVLLRSANLW